MRTLRKTGSCSCTLTPPDLVSKVYLPKVREDGSEEQDEYSGHFQGGLGALFIQAEDALAANSLDRWPSPVPRDGWFSGHW